MLTKRKKKAGFSYALSKVGKTGVQPLYGFQEPGQADRLLKYFY